MTILTDESRATSQALAAPADEHPPFLHHHWDTPGQQFEASKFGMWLFLATEVLLFGGLFCAYAVWRRAHPDVFAYGSRFLDTRLGSLNTVVLILSSVTMATAVTAVQRNQKWLMLALLFLTFLGGAGFMGVKYIEYSHKIHENLVWGTKFYEPPHAGALAGGAEPSEAVAPAAFVPDPARGRAFWMATCRSCHGPEGQGLPGQGKDMRGSEFIAGKSDQELLAFVKVGRMPFDPLNTTGIQMPPRGGNPMLRDDDLRHVIAFLRTLDLSPLAAGAGAGGAAAAAPPEEFWVPRWTIPDPPAGPAGLALANLDRPSPWPAATWTPAVPPPDPRHDPQRPANAHAFFAIYFCMTGLHGLHVLAGMAVIFVLMVRGLLGHFSSAYFTPVDLGGLYWHIVDLIWIFLFPLFYLI